MNSQPDNPSRLETVILSVSFLLLWAWFLVRQSVYRAGGQPSLWLSLPLVLLLAALVWVFTRRLRRVVRAMKEQKIGIGRPPITRPDQNASLEHKRKPGEKRDLN